MDFSKYDKINIHFIIGPGRSGTTLLAMIFNNHNNCISAPEIKHFVYFYNKYKNITSVTESLLKDLRIYFDVIKSSKSNTYFSINCDNLLRDLEIGTKITYAQLTKFIYIGLYKTLRETETITFIIDKNPFYTFHVDKINAVFPDAKFITILRDYRSYVLSNRQSQNPFVIVKSLGYYCAAWNFHADRIIDIKKKMSDKLLIIYYENFVLNKEEEMRKVFDFLSITYDESVFNYTEKLTEKISQMKLPSKIHDRALKTVTDLMKPVNSERIAAWKKEFTQNEIAHIETLCGSRGENFNYEKTSQPNYLKSLYYRFISIPGYIRVAIFYLLNSPKIHHYLNETRKANFESKK